MKDEDQPDDDTGDEPENESVEVRLQLRIALALTGHNVYDLWVAYFGVTGALNEQDITAWLAGTKDLPRSQIDLLALATDELLELSRYDLRVSPQSHPRS